MKVYFRYNFRSNYSSNNEMKITLFHFAFNKLYRYRHRCKESHVLRLSEERENPTSQSQPLLVHF